MPQVDATQKSPILIAFGANLGEPEQTLKLAVLELEKFAIRVTKIAEILKNPALDLNGDRLLGDQALYYNTVLLLETALSPLELLRALLSVEKTLGRIRTPGLRFESRLIDLDLICYGQEILNTPELILPHPEMHKRDFVLVPMAEILSGWRHPVLGKSTAELLKDLS